MINTTNQAIVDEWSEFSEDDLRKFGDEGDNARVTLLDPVIFELLPSVKGKTVLDAGCGNGYLARKLASKGALVTGAEPATNLYEYCIKRESELNQNISYLQQDLTALKTPTTYDIVTLVNVLMDIPDYTAALVNCVEALKTGGIMVISILHPAFPGFEADWKRLGYSQISEYFSPEPIKQKYGYLFNRPIQDYFNRLLDLGCTIQRVIEPQITDAGSTSRSAHVPQFLVIKIIKS